MSTFSLDVSKWCAASKDNMHKITRTTLSNILTAIDLRSPVGNKELWAINNVTMMNREMFQLFRESRGKKRVSGKTLARKFAAKGAKGYVGGRFRANWQLGVDTKPTGELYEPGQSSYPSGAATVAMNNAIVSPLAGGHLYYIVNNLPYAQRLEDGWSTQAPAGIVRLTVMEFQQHVDAAVAAVVKGGK